MDSPFTRGFAARSSLEFEELYPVRRCVREVGRLGSCVALHELCDPFFIRHAGGSSSEWPRTTTGRCGRICFGSHKKLLPDTRFDRTKSAHLCGLEDVACRRLAG